MDIRNIHWLGHDSFCIKGGGVVIYTDPWQIEGGPEADLILITHDHSDHCSPKDVAKIRGKNTVIVTIEAAMEKLSGPGEVETVSPGDTLSVKGVPISVVPAYNINKFRSPGELFHPRNAGHAGFIFGVEGLRIYHTGDTDLIPEMETVETDIALLPVSGIYVMTAEEAAEAAGIIKPKIAIPMHVGRDIGILEDADYFKEKAPVPVEVLPIEDPRSIC